MARIAESRTMIQLDEALTSTIYASTGRDTGKSFKLLEIDPMTKAGYALRFNSALRVDSYQALIDMWREGAEEGAAPIDAIMKTLQGSDAQAIHALVSELLDYVHVAPDPQHPGAFRPLMKTDIREMRTLGDVLLALVKLNFISEA
jgi:hypothetical protein